MRFGNSKGQLMTLIMLVVFILMLAELFAFALINISSNSISQSLTLTSSSANYGNLFRLSANNFAYASLSRAIATLANYESTPAYRKGNFITNTSLYLSYLVTNGVLPNDTSGYPQNAMGNLTLKLYNLSVANVIGFGSQAVTINETEPIVFQTDPYHIRVAYTESIAVNTSGNDYKYTIPVNVSLPLNGTPDLLYSQQGITSQIRFASMANLTSAIGGMATSGNTLAYGYGTVYWLPSNSVSGATCSSIPGAISSASVSGNIVLATYNAIGLEGCENNYAGLIAYIAPTTLPTVAYLIYPSSSNFLQLIPTGTRVLVYGPMLETLNIEGLRNAITNGYYFASPFTPSYLDRADGDFNTQSPNGIFTFSNYNRQAASLTGLNSNIVVQDASILDPTSTVSISAWVYLTSYPSDARNGEGVVGKGSQYELSVNSLGGATIDGILAVTPVYSSVIVPLNKWTYISGGLNKSGTAFVCVNGACVSKSSSSEASLSTSTSPLFIGYGTIGSTSNFNGLISNVQVYNQSLNSFQIQTLYQEGISALPLSNNALIGWWPLDGNANDYGGYGHNGAKVNMNFVLIPNYSRDSILNTPVPTKLSPIPGILSCTSTGNCASNTLPNLYLGTMPLEVQSGHMQTANLNGQSSSIEVPYASDIALTGNFAIGWWFSSSLSPSTTYDQEMVTSRCQTDTTFDMQLENTVLHGDIGTGTGTWLSTGVNYAFTPLQNTWYFIEVVFANTGWSIFLNGKNVSYGTYTGNPSLLDSNDNLNIGGACGANLFDGKIANMQLYNTAIGANEIYTLYQEGIGGAPINLQNLVGWWPLDGNANDYSGFTNNGVATAVTYPYFSGTYNAPGLSTIATSANEWQALGLATPQ